jgi:hypothetical protein
MRSINMEDVKAITDGAIRQAKHVEETADLDSKVIDRQILKRAHSTFYNRVYLRKYEPDNVRMYHKA